MATVRAALEGLPDDAARARVLRWASDAAGIDGIPPESPAGAMKAATGGLNDLLDRATPGTRAELILAVAFWLEGSNGGSDWTSQAVNDQLKQLGEGVPNITDALSSLMAKKPALVRQTRKGGRTQQARKKYLLTAAGRSVVSALLAKRASDVK